MLNSTSYRITIATQIAIENNSASIHALRIISRLLTDLKDEAELRYDILSLVRKKMMGLANSIYLEPWIQNMTLGLDNSHGECPYNMPLCHLAMGEDVKIWNNDWLKADLTKDLPYDSIINSNRIQELKKEPAPVIKLVIRNSYADEELDIPEEVDEDPEGIEFVANFREEDDPKGIEHIANFIEDGEL